MQRISKRLANVSAGKREIVKLFPGTKYRLFSITLTWKLLITTVYGEKISSDAFKKWVHVSALCDERNPKVMGEILVGEVRMMNPFGIKMEELVETERGSRRRKKLRLDWEWEMLAQCRKMRKKGIPPKVLSKDLNWRHKIAEVFGWHYLYLTSLWAAPAARSLYMSYTSCTS